MRSFYGTKNFGYSTVLTPPSPALSGTTLTLVSGEGARFPDPATVGQYPVVMWPTGVDALDSNAEEAIVTGKSGDVLTIVRAQNGSSAKSVIATFQIEMAITAQVLEDIYSALQVGYLKDRFLTTLTRLNSTQFTTTGDQTTIYTKGRLLRFNSGANYAIVTTSSFSLGVTTVTVTAGTVTNPLTAVECAIQPLGQTAQGNIYLDVIDEKTAAAGVTVDGVQLKDGYLVLLEQGSDPAAPDVTHNTVFTREVAGVQRLYFGYYNGSTQFVQQITGQVRQYPERAILGAFTTGSNKCPVIIVGKGITKVTQVYAYSKTAPTGADLIFDINKNGTSLWNSTPANRLKVVAGANYGTQSSFDTTSVAEGDILTIDIDQIGSTVPGADVTIEVFMEA